MIRKCGCGIEAFGLAINKSKNIALNANKIIRESFFPSDLLARLFDF
jgi:hypothetical protein